MTDVTETPWPDAVLEAELHWDENQTDGYLHFTDPNGERAVVSVTRGHHTSDARGNVWHVDVEGDVAVVSPSVHFIGRWHSPNPVRFRIVEGLFG